MSNVSGQTHRTGRSLWQEVRRFHATTLSGLYRWPREHYRVFVGHTGGTALVAVPAPRWSYYADPFLWQQSGQLWLFAEQFLYFENRARLVAVPLDAELRPRSAPIAIALADGGHASFPCVFAHAGALFLLPETSSAGSVDLYRCEELPHRWRHEQRLLANIDAADTVPLHHEGRWWLLTSLRRAREDGGHRALGIFSSDTLLAGRWQPHPVNAERRYADSPFSWGRGAGPLLAAGDGAWLRPFQASRRYYGEAIGWMRIERLTGTEFIEHPLKGSPPFAAVARGLSPHHISWSGDFFACDVRDRVGYGQHVPGFRRWALQPTDAAIEGCAPASNAVR